MEINKIKPRSKKKLTLGTIVLSAAIGITSLNMAYAPQEKAQATPTKKAEAAQKADAVQEKEQATQANQEEQKSPKKTDGIFYAIDCPDCPGMYAYFQQAYNTYFILPHRNIYEITIMPGDSFNRWQENEGWPKDVPPKSTQLLVKLLHYVNKEPFDHINLIAGQTMRVIDFDGDDSVMKRSMEFYGRRLTAEEMEETQKHNQEYEANKKLDDEQVKK
ncbi:hypothetical protein JXB28_04925 [Candidatus Woesearchaeota archaeon]|nr:hypothetical protein [Candidatus Woesearchaeota archaeon]